MDDFGSTNIIYLNALIIKSVLVFQNYYCRAILFGFSLISFTFHYDDFFLLYTMMICFDFTGWRTEYWSLISFIFFISCIGSYVAFQAGWNPNLRSILFIYLNQLKKNWINYFVKKWLKFVLLCCQNDGCSNEHPHPLFAGLQKMFM